jgi:hypothetical protein
MPKLTIDRDHLNDVRAGDRLVAIDDITLSAEKILTDGPRRLWPNGPIGIPFETGTPVEGYLYPDSLVGHSITVERVGAEPEREPEPTPEPVSVPTPAVYWTTRERRAVQRNPHYEETLRLLSDPDGLAVDLRKRDPGDGRWHGARHYSHQAGLIASFYGWTERVADYTWRLTPSGRRVLAVLDRKKER